MSVHAIERERERQRDMSDIEECLSGTQNKQLLQQKTSKYLTMIIMFFVILLEKPFEGEK